MFVQPNHNRTCPLPTPQLFVFLNNDSFPNCAEKYEWEPACECMYMCICVCVCNFVCKGVKESSTYGYTPNITHTQKNYTKIFTLKCKVHVVFVCRATS